MACNFSVLWKICKIRLRGGNLDIWVKDLPDGPERRLTFDDTQQRAPWWTPDGRDVTYLSGEGGPVHVWANSADFTGTPRPILEVGSYSQGLWSPDGSWLVLRAVAQGTGEGARDIVGFRPGTDTVPVPLIATPYADEAPALSPDGRWLAYVSDETGRPEVFVVPFPDVGGSKVQVSRDAGERRGLRIGPRRHGTGLSTVQGPDAVRDFMAGFFQTVRRGGELLQ